ncbi:MAG: ATPase, partial [Chloroflexi bacterium]|nr:ATPase [Chloroflexota bacterium]
MNPPTAFGEVFSSGDVDGQALKLAVVDSLPCGVIIVDTAGHVVLQHSAFVGDPVASGASDGSHNIRAIGPRRLDSGLPPPPDPEQFSGALIGKVVPAFEYSYRLPGDLVDRWAVAVASPLHDVTDRITGAVAIYNDITARKRREETLKRAHDFGSAVVNTAGCLVVVHDRQGRVELFNQACEHTTGYTLAEVLGLQTW